MEFMTPIVGTQGLGKAFLRIATRLTGRFDGWRLCALGIALAAAAPVALIFLAFLDPEPEIWRHLATTVLVDVMVNTAMAALGVLVGTAFLGIACAWLTGACDFPGRTFFSWALLLPLAMPTYVMAFVYLGLLDYAGPVRSFLRASTMWGDGWFPPFRSAGGVIVVLSLALFPYVYLLVKSAFQTRGIRAMEAARSLGCSPWRAFFRVTLPMARPWIAGGAMLVLMETLADFGAVAVFNFDTFTTTIYKTWFGFFSLPAAAQLSSMLVMMVVAAGILEERLRGRMRFAQSGRGEPKARPIVLRGWRKWAAASFSGSVVLAAFVIPMAQLLFWAVGTYRVELDGRYLKLVGNTLLLGISGATLVIVAALILAVVRRHREDRATRMILRSATFGYAVPGTVLAVGITLVLADFERVVNHLLGFSLPSIPPVALQGTVLTVLAAYGIRFMTVGFNPIEGALHRISSNVEDAARGLGLRGGSLLSKVYLPLLRPGLVTAALLVVVEVVKEMPITLMTRPFGWDTLAVKIFELTSEGEWERAALPGVLLVLAGLIPVIFLTREADRT
jgi:iron(III) transport system permease protein